MDMEEAQTQVQKNKPKAVKPRPQPVGKKKGQGVVSKEGRPDIDSGNTGAAGISSKAAVLGEDVDEDFLPTICEDDLALVGAFGDEDLDDSHEHEVVLAMKGKVPMKSVVALTEEMDPDLVLLPLAQRQDRATSGTKRKTLHDDVLEFSDCSNDLMSPIDDIEPLDSDKDSEIMDVNEFKAVVTKQPVKAKVKTSVTTTSSKAPPLKKVKAKKEHTATMVLKSNSSWVESVLKAHSTYLNTDLPPGYHKDTKWDRIFVLTIFLWLGAQEEPWMIPDKNLLHACCEIFKVIYPDIKYQVVMSGSVFGVVTQHIIEWCSNFRSTVFAIIIAFCTSNRDTSAKELLTLFLQQYAFLYPNPDEINKDKTFHSAFVLELLATAHLYHTLGHADVPTLNTDNLAQGGFVEALGLCAVSLKHAFALLGDNAVSIKNLEDADMPTTAQKTCFKTPKTLNKATGKKMGTEHAFSVVKWGMKTAAFVWAANKKGPEATCLMASMAYKHLKKPGGKKYASINSEDEMDDHEDVW
ncbi:uncharacterized protein BJ212DRAFT_1302836 [Suillus subaureus]|uniref:Uncharacterized protein n=1 Tax=Suillus subaureus TaxID=48587 RepID=A0A9P7J8V8_9AGAM|nr:uncharacterized protein BJ212DRAFT_1302836 [Suillus subaureus]KAG1808944.1 hypothetical protein BJ212DRAFT_1302836 [Suillus subaureus]